MHKVAARANTQAQKNTQSLAQLEGSAAEAAAFKYELRPSNVMSWVWPEQYQ